ncbi:hypothetical protein NQZ68_002990 [Dissostichus eleginoides]|nr:hypothetical protein NQZ68_002990 [Dissostichus eleginoides]
MKLDLRVTLCPTLLYPKDPEIPRTTEVFISVVTKHNTFDGLTTSMVGQHVSSEHIYPPFMVPRTDLCHKSGDGGSSHRIVADRSAALLTSPCRLLRENLPFLLPTLCTHPSSVSPVCEPQSLGARDRLGMFHEYGNVLSGTLREKTEHLLTFPIRHMYVLCKTFHSAS